MPENRLEIAFVEQTRQDAMQGDAGIIPLQTEVEAENMYQEAVPEVIPVLPLRNAVMYPGIIMPITVSRKKSIDLVETAYRNKQFIGIITQSDNKAEEPQDKDLYRVGTLSRVVKLLEMSDGVKSVVVQGVKPFRLLNVHAYEPYMQGHTQDYPTNDFDAKILNSKDFNNIIASLVEVTSKYINISLNYFSTDALYALKSINNRVFLLNFIASNLQVEIAEKQRILEISDISERASVILNEQSKMLQMAQLNAQMQKKTSVELDKQQREYFLNQQIKAIQEELGNAGVANAVNELKKKGEAKKWDEKTKDIFEREIQRLQRLHQMSPDYTTQLNYLELLVELPWYEYTEDNLVLTEVQKILEEDHFGLEKIKKRIVEYLAVLKLRKDMKSPILCFVGPPGVGKTSLGKSVARAMNRKYIRMSLGGMRDESEIRGHRKTYIGAMPGRIMQSLRRAGSANPVFVLDEIDKLLGMNIQGDPSAAMLEVLDPEQNTTFYDNYLETTFDLSRVLFIATANTISTIHPALVDRMEVIELSSYLQAEKVNIAKRHLIPRQITEHGLQDKQLSFPDEVIEQIISDYTREAGVRILEKQLAKVIRHKAFQIVNGNTVSGTIDASELPEILGVPLYKKERDLNSVVNGVAIGLAWTPVGGDILFIETAVSEGKGNLTLTGNLGDVMKESATIAYEYIKVHAKNFDLAVEDLKDKDVYIHIPEGATPKDGPSAGITILTALLSTLLNKPIRENMAMTGEITLRGKITPVGGIKEKILAAKQAKIRTIVLPLANKKDIEDIEKEYVEGLEFHYFDNMTDALKFNFKM